MLRLGTKVDVVVTDHAMPGMTGAELARQIRQRWPELPVILATGYAELPNGEEPGLPRLSKPYLQDELAAQIGRVMSAAPTNVIPLDSARRA
jgi:CheY-like chemotaxis protein